jgi:hypothetical protein
MAFLSDEGSLRTSLPDLTPGLVEACPLNLDYLLFALITQIRGNALRSTTTTFGPDRWATGKAVCDNPDQGTKEPDPPVENCFATFMETNVVDLRAEDTRSNVMSQVVAQTDMNVREILNGMSRDVESGSCDHKSFNGLLQQIHSSQVVDAFGAPLNFKMITEAKKRTTFGNCHGSVWMVNSVGRQFLELLFLQNGLNIEHHTLRICTSKGVVEDVQFMKVLNEIVTVNDGIAVQVVPKKDLEEWKKKCKGKHRQLGPCGKRNLKEDFCSGKVYHVPASEVDCIEIPEGEVLVTNIFKLHWSPNGVTFFTNEDQGREIFIIDQVRIPGTQKVETSVRLDIGLNVRVPKSLSMIACVSEPVKEEVIVVPGDGAVFHCKK